MFLAPHLPRRPRALLLGVCLAALTGLGTLAQTPASAAVSAVPATPAAGAATVAQGSAQGTTQVSALALTGTTTRVTVRRVYRTGQVRWIDHVLDTRLLTIDGCQARRSATSWRANVYRATVFSVCPQSPAAAEGAARSLVRSRPWYRVQVGRTALVGFTLLADLPSGNDRAVPAAVRQLPSGPSVFFEGDDVSLAYAGPGVTQNALDAAVAAFAQALGITTDRVTVTPLTAD